MTVKQWILSGLTLLVTLLMVLSLLNSFAKPQIQRQIELYQTNLLLQASEWEGVSPGQVNSIIGTNPVSAALDQYRTVQTSAQETLADLTPAPSPPAPTSEESEVNPSLGSTPIRQSPKQQLRQLLAELQIRIGILQAQLGEVDQAQSTWGDLIAQPQAPENFPQKIATAEILTGLWSTPPRLLPDAEAQLQRSLSGWFRYQALAQLYQLQQRQDTLASLQAQEQASARSALVRLALVGLMPTLGSLMGLTLLIGWAGLRFWKKSPELAENQPDWSVPWAGDTIWQVMVLWFTGFFAVSLLIVPLVVQLLGLNPVNFGSRTQALFALVSYSALMATGFTILYRCLKPFVAQPFRWLPLDWQRRRWILWGVGGYLVALPLVIVVSLINQRLLEQGGGANPLLEIILRSQDNFTIAILFLMVAVLAPVFEETLFRGFFLTSLTRYLPTWGAILASGILFAVAHLNLSDILPLTALGIVLGVVYTRSRNLLASMLLHSIWNSGSLLGLLILAGGAN